MKYLCFEHMADGPEPFVVDSEETFNAIVELSQKGSSEADAWGGFKFDPECDTDDMDYYESQDLSESTAITMADVEKAKEQAGCNEPGISPDDYSDDPYESPWEKAYCYLLQ